MKKIARTIVINDLVSFGKKRSLKSFVERILDLLEVHIGHFEFTFVDNDAIVKINQEYLKRDYATDIISFNLGDSVEIEGDVYISIEKAAENAQERQLSTDEEVHRLLVHGILHLLDYEDYTPEEQAVMFEKQEELLQKTGIIA